MCDLYRKKADVVKKDIANRINGLARPVGNALTNDVFDIIIQKN
jgi:hypothetical protein